MVDVAEIPGLVRADGVTTASAQGVASGDNTFERFPQLLVPSTVTALCCCQFWHKSGEIS